MRLKKQMVAYYVSEEYYRRVTVPDEEYFIIHEPGRPAALSAA